MKFYKGKTYDLQSLTFDLSSLQNDMYMYNARNLHPIQGMDTIISEAEEGWDQCNYLSTYQNWVKHTTNLKESNTTGKYEMRLGSTPNIQADFLLAVSKL